jgi:hypothetical protein
MFHAKDKITTLAPMMVNAVLKDTLPQKHSASFIQIRWNIKKDKCDYRFFSKGWLIIFEDIELTETILKQ